MVQDLVTKYKGQILAAKNLPTLPAVLDEITQLMENPHTSTEQIAQVITRDQVLSAKVLKMVNSPIYGCPGRISSVSHALVLLGFNVIRGLIISTSVFDKDECSMVGLWDHSVGCALACGEVARALGFKDPEEYVVSGLLHDFGKLVTAVQLPEAKKSIDMLVKKNDMTYREAELEVLSFGHDRVNLWISELWNLPTRIGEAIAYHHTPLEAPHHMQFACVVHVGDFLVRAFEYGYGGDSNVPQVDPLVFKLLQFNQRLLEQVFDNLCIKFIEVENSMTG